MKKQIQPHKKRPAPTPKKVEVKKSFSGLYLAIILIITFIAFSGTFKNAFIDSWDDGVYLTDNAMITQLNTESIHSFFTTQKNGTYVPIPMLSFAIEYKFFKYNPLPYHIDNLILHLLCVTLVFFILRFLKLNTLYAAIGALLFGVHPLRVESVAWVTERKDLIYSLFYLGAIVTYIKYVLSEKKKTRWFIFTLILFVLSLFSKIQAVTLPLSLLLIDYWFLRPIKWKLVIEKIPFFLLSLGFGIAGFFILQKIGSIDINTRFSLIDRLFFGMYALSTYVFKLFVPFHISAFYPYPVSPGHTLPILYYLNPLFLVALFYLVYRTIRFNRAILFGSLFFLLNIMFLLQIVGAGQAFLADRFTYVPYLGFFFIAGWTAQYYSEKISGAKTLILAVAAIYSLVFFITTIDRCRDWHNSETLWSDVIKKYPKKIPDAYANRASFLRKANRWDQALEDYNYAVSLDPKNAISVMNRGNIYFDKGQDELAMADYRTAMHLKTENNKVYGNMGAIMGRRGIYDSALFYINKAIALDSLFLNCYINRALTYERLGRWQDAIADYKKYLVYKPETDDIYSSIGVDYQNMKQFNESFMWFDKAIKMNPRQGIYLINRSYSYNGIGNKEKAREDAMEARNLGIKIPPQYAQLIGLK